ncbi:MAG: ABC transporter, partial [Rhizobiales bacterium]|nr:ABC transporter [Hyphomicrobiales bacterium]
MGKISTPYVMRPKVTLRILGTDVTLISPIKELAEAELGINLEFIILDGVRAQRQGALEPDSFDVYDQWFHDVDLIWPSRSIKPIDTARIKAWEQVNELSVFNSSNNHKANLSSPRKRLFVQPNEQLGSDKTQYISMLPTVHNADSFAIIGADDIDHHLSWEMLLSEKWRGRVAIQAEAAIGVLDLLMAFDAKGEQSFQDLSNLNLEEIDLFIRMTRQYQVKNQFLKFWTDKVPLPSDLKTEKPILSTMWWTNYISIKASGAKITMCTPKEGYRGWFGGM